MLATSWALVAESATLLQAAQSAVSWRRLQELHAVPAERVEQLISRGREDGVFRTDLPISWLVSAVHYLLEGAAEELRAGRLDGGAATRIVTPHQPRTG